MVIDCDTEEMTKNSLYKLIKKVAGRHGFTDTEGMTPGEILENLIENLAEKNEKGVAVLIDEYDYPINNVLDNMEVAQKNLKTLHDFYVKLKNLTLTGKIHCLFITGVTKISHVSLFSAFNNLMDLTLHPEYANICGFTEREFDKYFGDYQDRLLSRFNEEKIFPSIKTKENLKAAILKWYDGYSFNGKNKILNPYSIINFFSLNNFSNFWFRSGTTTFLVKNILNNPFDYAIAETQKTTPDELLNLTLTKIKPIPLLFQTGYLTLGKRNDDGSYFLRLPNDEVAESFTVFLRDFISDELYPSIASLRAEISGALLNCDSKSLEKAFQEIFTWVPRQLLLSFEKNYHGLLFVALKTMGFDVAAEVPEQKGDLDLLIIVKWPPMAFIIELKHHKLEKEREDGDGKNKVSGKGAVGRKTSKTAAAKIAATKKKLLERGLILAKTQIEEKHYADRYLYDFPTIKKVAASIVGKGDIAVEIYDKFEPARKGADSANL
jgi:hypothetical protein